LPLTGWPALRHPAATVAIARSKERLRSNDVITLYAKSGCSLKTGRADAGG
jgi:hypothetical protein